MISLMKPAHNRVNIGFIEIPDQVNPDAANSQRGVDLGSGV